MSARAPAATRVLPNAVFVVSITALATLAAWLATEVVPVLEETPVAETLPGWGQVALGAWMLAISAVSIIGPLAALAVWGGDAGVRRVLLPYVLVLVAQISIEITLRGAAPPNVVVLTGLAFTGYRLLQLRSCRRFFRGAGVLGRPRKVVGGLLTAGLAFWAANGLFLLLVALPLIVKLP